MSFPKNIHGMQAAALTARDPDVRRVLASVLSPTNFDGDSIDFPRGKLAVRRTWIEDLIEQRVRDAVSRMVATDSSGGTVTIELEN